MANRTEADIFLVNLETLEQVSIMFVPNELEWESVSNWAVIPTIGRNNPFYHYTSGEDTLSFELDWYANDESRVQAINACTKIKSWARNNGFSRRPPRIQLIWGNLFQNHVFIIQESGYRLSNFQRPKGMMPAQAYQTIVLKKVTPVNESTATIDEQFSVAPQLDQVDPNEISS